MANKGNDLPPKLYKKMLTESYFQTKKDETSIKNYLAKNHDPILQKEDRYIPPRTRGNVLTEQYIKKMAEKPEKTHIKRIPLKNNLSSGVIVIAEPNKRQGIKMNPKIRRNQDSMKTNENQKHLRTYKNKDNLKNFYFDNFNSVKQNQNNLEKIKASVSYKIITNNIYIFLFQRRYINRPKDNDIIPPKPIENGEKNNVDISYARRNYPEKTYDRIFNSDKKERQFNIEQEKRKGVIRRDNKPYRDSIGKMFEEQGKISRIPKIAEKPCNDNFQILSSEAKKNYIDRYYYDNYSNQFKIAQAWIM